MWSSFRDRYACLRGYRFRRKARTEFWIFFVFWKFASFMSVDELRVAGNSFHLAGRSILIFYFPIWHTPYSLCKSPFQLTVQIIDCSQRCFDSGFDQVTPPPPSTTLFHLTSLIYIKMVSTTIRNGTSRKVEGEALSVYKTPNDQPSAIIRRSFESTTILKIGLAKLILPVSIYI